MNNYARRLHIVIGDNWRSYQPHKLPGITMIGTVRRGNGAIGALGRISTGIYVQITGGVVRKLDQHKVIAALKQ